jgi:hypothetical protein
VIGFSELHVVEPLAFYDESQSNWILEPQTTEQDAQDYTALQAME